jgi:hypothetical protein
MIAMNQVEQVLDQLRKQLPRYDAYYKVYDDIEEDLLMYREGSFSTEYDVYADGLGDLLKDAIDADLVWPDDAEPSLHYVVDWDGDAGVLELNTYIDIDRASASDALAKVRRESEVGQPANAEDFNWRQYEVSILIEAE